MLVLGDEQRNALKAPFGTLVQDALVTRSAIKDIIGDAALVVAVGDATTQRMAELGIGATIEIVDGKEQRGERDLPSSGIKNIIKCKNAPGTLSAEAADAVKQALASNGRARIIVDGEEDLFVLLVCDACPQGAAVAYGQPGQGMVVLRVDDAARDKARRILGSMRIRDDETVAE